MKKQSRIKEWDDAYKAGRTPWRKDSLSWLKKLLKNGRNKAALDLGCGTGEAAKTISEFGYSVVAVDFSEEALQKIPRKIKVINWDLEKLDDLNLDQKFDLVLDSKVFAFIKNKRKYLQSVSRLLKTSGKLIIQGFFKVPGKQNICISEKDLKILSRYFFQVEGEVHNEDNGTEWFVFVLNKK